MNLDQQSACSMPRLFSAPRKSYFWRIIAAVWAAGTPLLSSAALSWEAELIELAPKRSDLTATAQFRFTNSGDAAVTITAVHSACGCTTAELAKKIYGPGESGEIKAVFTIGDRVGRQEKTIQVTTSDEPAKPTTLTLRVEIPERLTYSPRLLIWRTTETLEEKSILIGAAGAEKIQSLEFAPGTPLTPRVEILEPGVSYRLFFKPTSLAQVANFAVPVIVHFADQSTQTISLYVLVK